MSVSIVLADDHDLVRSGLRLLLESEREFSVIGEAGNGCDAIELVRALAPTVAILDISMPILSGIECARVLCREAPNTAVIILSMYTDEGHVLDALGAGALGYVLKSAVGNEFIEAVQTVANRRLYLSPPLSAKIMHSIQAGGSSEDPEQLLRKLSTREREILQLVVEGHSSAKIAAILGLASNTVDTYRSRVMAKLHIENLPNLVRFAIRHGILPLQD
jgi:DNA-binding NarL/FixJ family response regulator